MARADTSTSRSGASYLDRIVHAIASRVAMGEERPCRKMIMGLALITSPRSFSTTLLNIKKKRGFVGYDRNSVWLTAAGRAYVGPASLAIPQSNDAMQDKIRENMVKGTRARKIYDLLLDGQWHTKAELAAMMNLENNKSFGTTVSSLSKIVERKGGKIRLVDMAFPCGRPEV